MQKLRVLLERIATMQTLWVFYDYEDNLGTSKMSDGILEGIR